MDRFLIIDLSNLIHRAYYAIPKEFTDKNGNPTNAIYGVASMLINVLQDIKPNYAIAVTDTKKPTFRHIDFTGYKAHRKPMDDMLSVQIPKINDLVEKFGLCILSCEGYEADDLVAALVRNYLKDCEVLILSNDKDLWQLVGDNVYIALPSTKSSKVEKLGVEEVIQKIGVKPSQIPDYKGLVGDQSDNIPGVYGIGPKTAINLLEKFGNLEGIYNNIDLVSPESLRKKLIEGYEQAFMSKNLSLLNASPSLEFSREASRYGKIPIEQVEKVLKLYDFKSLLKRLGIEPLENKKDNNLQTSLFGD